MLGERLQGAGRASSQGGLPGEERNWNGGAVSRLSITQILAGTHVFLQFSLPLFPPYKNIMSRVKRHEEINGNSAI